MHRGEVWWANLPEPVGSEPGYRRPVLIIQADEFTQSAIRTVIVAILTSNIRLSEVPGNVVIPGSNSGLERDSVVNVSQLYTADKSCLTERIGLIKASQQQAVDDGLRTILSLDPFGF